MKKLLLASLGGVLMLSSCSKNSDLTPQDSSSVSTSSVPTVVQSALTTSFPTASQTSWSIDSPEVYQAVFRVAGGSKIADIQGNGKMLRSFEKIDAATLPAAVTEYLNANYAGYTVEVAGVKKDSTGAVTGYKTVILQNNTRYSLLFDGTGKFVKLDTHNGKHKGTPVAQADLLAAIKTYLDTNYKGYTFVQAMSKSTNGTVTGYSVGITFDGVDYFVSFDAAGVFVNAREKGDEPKDKGGHGKGNAPWNTLTDVTQADLPAAIGTYLDTTYKGFVFVDAKVAKDSAGVVVKYIVHFTLSGKRYHAEFDKDGKLTKVRP
jgi:uncharacterized protein YfiM (DUF2279 family)